MPRKKAQPAAASGTDSPLLNGSAGEAATPTDAGAPETSKAAADASNLIYKQMNHEGIEAYELPKAVLARVAKAELPENVQIRREALLAISKSATIFISYLAAVSDELAKQANRKSITPTDVVEGLSLMEFPESVRTQLKKEIREFRDIEGKKKNAASARKAAASNAADASATVAPAAAGADEEEEGDEDEEDDDMAKPEALGPNVTSSATALSSETDERLVRETDDPAAADRDAGLEQPATKPVDEIDVDEEDEDTEQRMVDEGAQEGDLEGEE
ncbi:unnamed protein product [Parajaminaea phylloscopi]